MFTIYSEENADSTVVPNLFIDEYMRDANDAQIKIYLYIVRMMASRMSTSVSEMADRFNHTEKEVMRSLRYWEKRGLIALDLDGRGELSGIRLCDLRRVRRPASGSGRVIPITVGAVPAAHPAEDMADMACVADAPARTQDGTDARKTAQSAAPDDGTDARPARGRGASAVPAHAAPTPAQLEAFRADEKRAQLIFVAEQYIGKPLATSEVRTLWYISESLRFSDDLIDYLLQYCVDRGKKDFRYIEKVAIGWAENGITTPKQAESALARASRRGSVRAARPQPNSFTRIVSNTYDYDELEKDLLEN